MALGPEAILYFLLGAATFGLGTVALARWAVESWQLGARLSVVSIACAAAIIAVAFLVLLRRRRRILAFGAVMLWLGLVAYALANFGFSLPPSWFG